MAILLASTNPVAPIAAIYTHEIVRILALPQGAAETAPIGFSPPRLTTECPGKKSTRCSATPIGPMPGPPPPGGLLEVLCRFTWHASAPISAVRHSPT